MTLPEKAELRELLFRVSVILKGLDVLLELVGGVALWWLSPGMIVRIVHFLTQDEIAEDPHDLVANLLRHAASHFSLSGEHFIAIYLIAHGVIKGFVVVGLLKNKLLAYPGAIVIFSGFIVYQVYRYALMGGVGLLALSFFDLIVIALIWLEYRAIKSGTSD